MHDVNDWLANELRRRYSDGTPGIAFVPVPSPNPATSDEVRVRVLTTDWPVSADDLDRIREDWIRRYGPDSVRAPGDLSLTVRKMTTYWPMSTEEAMEHGLIPDTRPPAPAVPWHRRARWAVSNTIVAARLRLGRWIAGIPKDEWDY